MSTTTTAQAGDTSAFWTKCLSLSSFSSMVLSQLSYKGCGGIVEEGTDYIGYDIEVSSNLNDFTSAESCAAKCFWEEACLFWSWNSQTLLCDLKSSDLGRVSDTVSATVTSGQRPCDVSPGAESPLDFVISFICVRMW